MFAASMCCEKEKKNAATAVGLSKRGNTQLPGKGRIREGKLTRIRGKERNRERKIIYYTKESICRLEKGVNDQ